MTVALFDLNSKTFILFYAQHLSDATCWVGLSNFFFVFFPPCCFLVKRITNHLFVRVTAAVAQTRSTVPAYHGWKGWPTMGGKSGLPWVEMVAYRG